MNMEGDVGLAGKMSRETENDRFATDTIVLGDIHLSDAEPPRNRHPLWKRFKQPDLFIDPSFQRLLAFLEKQTDGSLELVLNGDIFDFDSVMALPEEPAFPVSWLERKRGLNAEEAKSRFKIHRILQDHPVFVETLRTFLSNGHRVVFVIGNHDMELHWPSVQRDIVRILDLPERARSNVGFADWFYISGGDTLIEHGNQYDAYCLCQNPVFPLIRKGSKKYVRIPFGDLAGKYMTNGMGLFNPHVESSFIMSVGGYIVFFFKYLLRIQPLLLWTWFWGATATLFTSLMDGVRPAYKNPFLLHQRINEIAERSKTTPQVVMSLRELRVHPAIFNPVKILRELWLDRALLLGIVLFGSFQIFSFLNVFGRFSSWWFWIPLLLLLAPFFFYAWNVNSDVYKVQKEALRWAPAVAWIAGVRRIIHGHTHRERHVNFKGIEVLNNGTWSPAFHDVECTRPSGRTCFTWIRPAGGAGGGPRKQAPARVAGLFQWKDPGIVEIPVTDPDVRTRPLSVKTVTERKWRGLFRRFRRSNRRHG
jgi:UDP-2,3-diacylglucosamine pyrophosphatase LpxH